MKTRVMAAVAATATRGASEITCRRISLTWSSICPWALEAAGGRPPSSHRDTAHAEWPSTTQSHSSLMSNVPNSSSRWVAGVDPGFSCRSSGVDPGFSCRSSGVDPGFLCRSYVIYEGGGVGIDREVDLCNWFLSKILKVTFSEEKQHNFVRLFEPPSISATQ